LFEHTHVQPGSKSGKLYRIALMYWVINPFDFRKWVATYVDLFGCKQDKANNLISLSKLQQIHLK